LKECNDETTIYAILSHRWGDGSEKIIKSCEQARKDGYEWLWIDTCCIDKRSSAELSEAINSMYRWYQNAGVCYAYLNDVDVSVFPTKRDDSNYAESNGWPVWFVRGWTLQELIAPKKVEFFNKGWVSVGDKWRLAPRLEKVTGIPPEVLRDGLAAKRLSVAQIMSWAAQRETTRVEDRAYSLMGLFGVNMPMLYGEGKKAFERLQLEIIRVSSDQSIFAWNPPKPRTGSVLADDPSDFRGCGKI
ncbi:heterokaryon incompatibility protein-domain-containing protein, partial [Pisolithus tinctorius]